MKTILKKTITRRSISILIALTLILSTSFCTFATTDSTDAENLCLSSVKQITPNKYIMYDGSGSSATTSILKTNNGLKIMLKSDYNEGYFEINNSTGKIYSSFTGNSIDIDSLRANELINEVNPMVVGDVVATYTKKISYKQIATLVGNASDAYTYADAIATLFIAATGLGPIPTLASLILPALVGVQFSVIVNNVQNNAKGGIRLTINKVEVTKHQGGNIVHGYAYQFGGISLY